MTEDIAKALVTIYTAEGCVSVRFTHNGDILCEYASGDFRRRRTPTEDTETGRAEFARLLLWASLWRCDTYPYGLTIRIETFAVYPDEIPTKFRVRLGNSIVMTYGKVAEVEAETLQEAFVCALAAAIEARGKEEEK